MKKTKEKCAAVLTIHDASEMSTKGIDSIMRWLWKTTKEMRDDKEYRSKISKRFTARYLY